MSTLKRYDPIEHYDQGGTGQGMMRDYAPDSGRNGYWSGDYVLYTDAKARHEQLLAALNDLITAVENDDHVFLALSHAKEQAEKLKEI